MDCYVDIIKKWLPPITKEDKVEFREIITGTKQTIGSLVLKEYVRMIMPHIGHISQSKEPDCLASGGIFFVGCLMYIAHFPKWGDYLEDILLYNLLYILVDHYIDDMSMDPATKKESVKQMFILVHNPLEKLDLVHPLLGTIAEIYHKLITRRPVTKDAISKVFKIEIEGLKIQNDPNCTREQYLDIAVKKGAYSIQVLQGIVGDTDKINDEQSRLWGAVLQLVDDSVDLESDTENKIYTVATYDIKTKGNLNDLWIETVKMLDVAERFIIFKVLFAVFLAYLPGRFPNNYTEELGKLVKDINMFEGFDSSTMLVELIGNEILAAEVI